MAHMARLTFTVISYSGMEDNAEGEVAGDCSFGTNGFFSAGFLNVFNFYWHS